MVTEQSGLVPARGLLTVKQFTHEYGVGRTNTFKLLNEGRLRAVKLGARTLIPRAAAEEFVQSLPPARSTRVSAS
jgi:excisionase family DNA binding protein